MSGRALGGERDQEKKKNSPFTVGKLHCRLQVEEFTEEKIV